MSLSRSQAAISSSLLDRLLDDHPDVTSEPQTDVIFDIRRYKSAVARDLEALLNTRSTCLTPDQLDPFPTARASILLFGIHDLSNLSLRNPDDQLFLQGCLQKAIEAFEPRLTNIRVSLDVSKDLNQIMRFRVDAFLKVHPTRPPVSFDAMLQLSSNTYQIKD